MERLLRVVTLLSNAGRVGIETEVLVERAGYGATSRTDRMRQFSRDRRDLERLGWQVENIGRPGQAGRYRLKVGDNRLRVTLTPAQRAALVRAAVAARSDSLAHALEDGQPELNNPSDVRIRSARGAVHLDLLLHAVNRRCRVNFAYKGTRRVLHPYEVRSGLSGWYLSGRLEDESTVKYFIASRMTEVSLDAPGTAEPRPSQPRPSLDPLSWHVDPQTDVEIITAPEHRRIVEHLLGSAVAERTRGEDLVLVFRVTNRSAFRSRLYELGTRVGVLGPEEFRTELIAELERRAYA